MALKSMREGMKPVMWAVAAAFVLSLFFVGATTLRKILGGGEGGPAVLVIDGKKIGQKQFEKVFYREMGLRFRKYQRDQKKPLTEEAEREMRLAAAGAAMNQIIQKEIILREAKKMGLRVTDEEIRSYLAHNDNFQVAGEFDQEAYERWLQEQLGLTPGETRRSWLNFDDLR